MGTETWDGVFPGSDAIVVCGRCWDEKMTGQWPGHRRDSWFRTKPRQRSEVVVMSPEPCAGRTT
jgi:hypothetical protein